MKLLSGFFTTTTLLALAFANPLDFEGAQLSARDEQLGAIHARNELAIRADAALNTTREYRLRSQVKAGQPNKSRFNNLYVYSYHTGAGLGDAVLTANRTIGNKGFLNTTGSIKGPSGQVFSNQEFDLGTEFPWQMIPEPNVNFYAAWEPVRINAGGGHATASSGFFINGTGLQWSSAPRQKLSFNEFGGWIVCKWWHPDLENKILDPAPQLFFRLSYDANMVLPCSCADVNLIPEYI